MGQIMVEDIKDAQIKYFIENDEDIKLITSKLKNDKIYTRYINTMANLSSKALKKVDMNNAKYIENYENIKNLNVKAIIKILISIEKSKISYTNSVTMLNSILLCYCNMIN